MIATLGWIVNTWIVAVHLKFVSNLVVHVFNPTRASSSAQLARLINRIRSSVCSLVGLFTFYHRTIQPRHRIFEAPVITESSKMTKKNNYKNTPDAKRVDEAVVWIERVKADKLISVNCLPVGPPSTSESLQGLTDALVRFEIEEIIVSKPEVGLTPHRKISPLPETISVQCIQIMPLPRTILFERNESI